MSDKSFKICFVCLGNICRSPVADGIARALQAEYPEITEIDSCGTGAWHVGNPPDSRMITTAAKRGVDLSPLRARQLSSQDYHEFDYLVAMDENNFQDIQDRAPRGASAKICKLLEFSGMDADVPDPYYGGAQGFENVFDLVNQGVRDLFDSLRKE